MADVVVASTSANLFSQITLGFTNFDTSILYIVPSVLAVYAFKQSSEFFKNNLTVFSAVEDALDRVTFQKFVVPLYEEITKNIFTNSVAIVAGKSATDVSKFLGEYELAKNEVLKGWDFSLLGASLDFRDTMLEIIASTRNHADFKKLKNLSRGLFICLTISSALSILALIVSNVFNTVLPNPSISNLFLLIYFVILFLSICIGISSYITKLKLDVYANK